MSASEMHNEQTCHKNNCLRLPVSVHLAISSGNSELYYSCAFISHQWSKPFHLLRIHINIQCLPSFHVCLFLPPALLHPGPPPGCRFIDSLESARNGWGQGSCHWADSSRTLQVLASVARWDLLTMYILLKPKELQQKHRKCWAAYFFYFKYVDFKRVDVAFHGVTLLCSDCVM